MPPRTAEGHAGVGAGGSPRPASVVWGYYPWKILEISDAKLCILEWLQHTK